jgi:hypothetical protein
MKVALRQFDQHRYATKSTIMQAVANKIMSLIEGGPDNMVIALRR